MPLSEEEATVIAREMRAAMKKDGTPAYTDDDIAMTLDSLHGEQDLPMSLRSGGFANWKEPVRFFGPMMVGGVGSGMLARRGLLQQGLGEAAGTAIGDITARALTGAPQNLPESLVTGGIAAGGGTVFRGATRLAGGVGGVPGAAVQEAGVPTKGLPSFNKVVRPRPRTVMQMASGVSDEAALVNRTRSAVQRLKQRITPERLQKVQLLKDAEAQGARIDPQEIVKALDDSLIPNAVTREAQSFNNQVVQTGINLINVAQKSGGALTPTQVDSIIAKQLRPKIYKASGKPSDTMIADAYGKAEDAAKEALDRAIPGKLGELNKKISARLKKAEQAERLFGGDKESTINQIRNVYGAGNEEKAAALKFLSDEADKKLLPDTLKLYSQRQFTADIREPSGEGGFFRTFVGRPLELASQAAAPLQPFAGPALGGAQAAAAPGVSQEIVNMINGMIRRRQKEQPNP